MKEININKIEAKKVELGNNIEHLINSFEEETHTIVNAINLNKIDITTHDKEDCVTNIKIEVHVR